ncbi:MAG TPA: exodeoxyribonuclease V subunit gamma [Acinetobacter lwoffii]|uniref:RecBCD enzyme subunit RecC n=2 Tax=Acinetobacter TaxID=469 RepID=A0A9D2USE4_ACILW|nr:exodeoxyribonuclease V subunit gamma [Acinetobacter sp. 10FS3-1]MDM1781311.1 exodeoxyribonuclease V subunit gamma [Acinetobacter indicus]QKQ68993.1 exonuclease V subunit gamma [Acinetobacter sp. 10FS3-1]HJF27682.1 exodeoxyribonuclease V subunit gamma [Acinetobacter lwoffii]
MAIHVIQSQRIDVLLDSMLRIVNQAAQNPFEVLQPRHFIVPSPAVEAWLTQKIAEKKGISANTQFHHRIRAFQWSSYQWVLNSPKEVEQVREANIPRIIIKWRMFQALRKYILPAEMCLDVDHPLYSIIKRIYDSADRLEQGTEKQLKKQSMLYWVAEQVSRLFSHYMDYRGYCARGCPPQQCSCPTNWLQAWGQDIALDVEQMIYMPKDENGQVIPVGDFVKIQARELEAWQRWLWQHVFQDDYAKILDIEQLYWERLENPESQAEVLKRLPAQVVVFSLLELPPGQLDFLRRLGQYIDIYIFHFNPSQEYWADSVDPDWKARYDLGVQERFIRKYEQSRGHKPSDEEIQHFFSAFQLNFNAEDRESRHPLLTRFGKQARDHFSLLSKLSSGEEGLWADAFVDEYQDCLLAKLQSDILYLLEPEKHQYPLKPDDDSLQIHVCHSSLRQLEVLKEQMIHWLAQGTEEKPRQPSDILVLAPNLKELEPAIRSVFAPPPREREPGSSRLQKDSLYLPIQIAGVSRLDVSNAWRAVLGRIQLVHQRFSIEDFADWLSLNATQQRYALDYSQVERMLQLLAEAGFKRGLDQQHLQQSLSSGDEDYRYSFKFALDRLALGMAMPEHRLFQDTLSYARVLSSDFPLITTLIQIYQDLVQRRDWLMLHEQGQRTPVKTWLEYLWNDLNEFREAGVDALKTVAEIIDKQLRMLTLADYHDQDDLYASQELVALSLPLPYVLEEIQNTLDMQLEQAEPSGQITFSQIGQIRPLPYKLVVMLNLDSGKFPGRHQKVPFDLMSMLKPQLGDRSRLDDEQGAFLDALLLAQENLWLFYNGFDVDDGEARDPSMALQELIQHIGLICESEQPDAEVDAMVELNGLTVAKHIRQLYHVHPLQPFDPAGFTVASTPRFQDQWFAVAKYIRNAAGQRSSWINAHYPALEPQEVRVLKGEEWIRDMIFPARLFLKSVGISSVKYADLPSAREPLLLNKLEQYQVRDFLLQQEQEIEPELMLDRLPVGKTRQATWLSSQQEQQRLQQRLLELDKELTPVTQQTWKLSSEILLNITVPQVAHSAYWLSMQSSSASEKRRAQVWLEYLLWLAFIHDDARAPALERIVIFSDKTLKFSGLSSSKAREYLQFWFKAWEIGQKQPLVLPAELLMKKNWKWAENEHGQMTIVEMQELLNGWNNRYESSRPLTSDESNQLHQDWQFILQDQDPDQALETCCHHFAHALYAPIHDHLEWVK